ncbi:hypothetical protein, unlikely [Trypanosoma brucei gambiense DAL972]|uniref:Uncharacterized protein n=1 Tax=Trypanosoma brucei gambiense (strain MHOM/CI/86/DAL972) TaxID=679716 RepID=D0A3D1_TRYB9|nr:hypothetical protein, unlikely [Trypanosoma brucei gambiense DAL972]CBH15775.1 hypothetical protein, unlikely [Trypanosoma brucei gambiense DAL972]|eukprot:XP_011778039.1 hypothetical protein, unlikely [Trypanosoma brucei gambiense DAL972]
MRIRLYEVTVISYSFLFSLFLFLFLFNDSLMHTIKNTKRNKPKCACVCVCVCVWKKKTMFVQPFTLLLSLFSLSLSSFYYSQGTAFIVAPPQGKASPHNTT